MANRINSNGLDILFHKIKFRWECKVGAATREQRYRGPSFLWEKSSIGSRISCRRDSKLGPEGWCEGNCCLRQEGIRGLWRGGLPTAQRAALVAGVQVSNTVTLRWGALLEYWHCCCSCQYMTPQRPSCLRMGSKMVLYVIWLQGGPPSIFGLIFNVLSAYRPLILNLFSFLAGLSACIASNPVDVVRTRMMVQRKTARYDLHQKNYPSFCK